MAKTSKSQKSERQKLIDSAMKTQRSADKRRGNVIIAGAVVLALAIVGYPTYKIISDKIDANHYASLDLASIGGPASVCQTPITRTATGVSQHVPEGTTVDYTDAPPAFGAHWNVAGVAPAPFGDKFYTADDRPALEALVHNLEHGYTIMWYDSTVAKNSSELNQIVAIASKFKSNDTNFRLKFIAAPWTTSDENGKSFPDGMHVAFTHWEGDSSKSTGVWQYCSQPSGAAVQSFMATYPYTDSPEASVV